MYFSNFLSSSFKSKGVLLLVGVLAGVTVGSGVGVIAATSTKSVTVCMNKADFMRYVKNGVCKAGETKLVLKQNSTAGAKGDTGSAGAKGDTGSAGAKGDTGPAGAKGDTGPAGAKGDTGPAGAKGDTGPAGTNGTNGTDGINGTSGIAIAQLSVCDGRDAQTVADELCKIGMTGPGGGPVFFVDYNDQYASFCATGDCNYLEASPNIGGTVAWCSDTSNELYNLSLWGASAVGVGRTNTASADITCTSGAVQLAVDYVSPVSNDVVSKDDWWLPSLGEMMLMYTNLRQAGVDYFYQYGTYWSSTQGDTSTAWTQAFRTGLQEADSKSNLKYVRYVRAF
jgi:hypothetical protein